ncbi:MAG TPA: DMT family transporter [Acidimicrobiales bacterium]
MAIFLALSSAAAYGIGDFCGGLATRRASAAAVVLWSHVLGLALLFGGALLLSGHADGGDLVAGAVGGLVGAAGIGLLYRALAIGTMSIVAPTTALLASSVPVLAGVVDGERPSPLVVLGMAIALLAVALVSAEGGGERWRLADSRAFLLALGAGLGFGLFFVALSTTSDDSGVWPLVTARMASVSAIGALAVAGRLSARIPAGPGRSLTLGAGVLDAAANVLYLLAIREGLLSVVSVLSGLYPVSTVLLARFVLDERLQRVQQLGVALALPAAVLIAL